MSDSFGRRIDYLRLSVTDHCNLRCLYCLPIQGFSFSKPEEILSDDEIERIVALAISLGINKIRITGGEPLVRPGICSLIKRISSLAGIGDISLSTNGLLLSQMAKDLFQAGLKRVNVSLDTLRPEHFQTIARFGSLEKVLEGIRAGLAVGFDPLKINMVVIKGINSNEIKDFVTLTHKFPIHVRFVELMPIGETGYFSREHWMGLSDIMKACGELVSLSQDESPRGFGPATYFKSPGALGTIGFISALSSNFCRRCNRLRLTAKGVLVPCLASEKGVDLKNLIRSGGSDQDLCDLIRQAVLIKPERHCMESKNANAREIFMCSLGG
ncbi:MAG: cyclic pyranopterin phosphate synthase MoaA [Elusimicrobia bacterium RIFCSPLOWO2_02_FULL_39_32]|nr:MAG: cyclic pyranopterin phosphate synthase MoaA [Elusimicrobia bacterium RIFCSPHIGHO2_02_FULL_39_36]OGR92089.1 MAG: cyclic pyranopterin phosphate synthase MoaA [Elusimicrobia bacterium RIFCSPLOWO2_02_FULL_39_32]OGR98794.1 MAG: cyclic pyranopterin phosphate synthase MoaA [Elusimicrobia bacterium RIFCSPLOWO2_12_FULL_39_28]